MATRTHKPRSLSPKLRRFVNDYSTAASGTDAALKNYDVGNSKNPRNTAAVISSQNLRKPAVRAAITAVQEAATNAAVATLHERKATLSAIIRDKKPGPYPVEAVISASDQLNKLERVYGEPQAGSTIIINVVREASPRSKPDATD